jgi:hypothetical protein
VNAQIVLAVAAVVGPLVGVLLGAFLGSRFEVLRWFRDRRLEAFTATEKALFDLFVAGRVLSHGLDEDLTAMAQLVDFRDALTAWHQACAAMNLLAGLPLLRALSEVNDLFTKMNDAARGHDSAAWDQLVPQLMAGDGLRSRLRDAMRKELAPDSGLIRWLARFG